MRLTFLKKHFMTHSGNSVSKSVDSEFSGRKEWGRRACCPISPPPPPPNPMPPLGIPDLCQNSGHYIARPYETFRDQRFWASTFQTFLGGWYEGSMPQISPLARTLGDSRSIFLYIYLCHMSGKGAALNYQNVTDQLEGFLYVIRIVIQNDRQKLKCRLKIAWFTKGNFGWPFSKPEPSAKILISLNENEILNRIIVSIYKWVLFFRATLLCW